MPKYYVQSGSRQQVIVAEDSQGAALAAMHGWLGTALNDEQPLPAFFELVSEDDIAEVCDSLGGEVVVSEMGFGRDEAGCFDAETIIEHWLQMLVALENLLKRVR